MYVYVVLYTENFTAKDDISWNVLELFLLEQTPTENFVNNIIKLVGRTGIATFLLTILSKEKILRYKKKSFTKGA
jgi:hypothetical protein